MYSSMALVIKNLPPNAGDAKDAGSTPGSGRSPAEENGSPLQYSCLENPKDRGAWWVMGSQRVRHNWAHTADLLLRPTFSPPENSCICYVSSNCFLKAVHSLSFCSLILLLDPPPPGFQTSLYPQQSQDIWPCLRVILRISGVEWKSSPVQPFRAS